MPSEDATVDPDLFYSDWFSSDSESDDDEIKSICYIVMTMICHCIDYINER
jgi:hypothetical protein